jgi:hypothetical protein
VDRGGLYRYRQELFGTLSVAFFDTTSLFFAGAGGESLGQNGHSKDYRPHLKQVVLGIVLDGADRPIASFLLPQGKRMIEFYSPTKPVFGRHSSNERGSLRLVRSHPT